jgi:hypothetical protein
LALSFPAAHEKLIAAGCPAFYHADVGFVGLLTGSKARGFSISVDTRYDATLDAGVIDWLLGKNDECKFLTFETRDVMESADDYPSALRELTTYKPLGPAYIIIAGSESGQGAVVAKAFEPKAAAVPRSVWNGTVDVWDLAEELRAGSFYVLETNYDRTTAPPGFDDRRYPAENCLEKTIGAPRTVGSPSHPSSSARNLFRRHSRQLSSCKHNAATFCLPCTRLRFASGGGYQVRVAST